MQLYLFVLMAMRIPKENSKGKFLAAVYCEYYLQGIQVGAVVVIIGGSREARKNLYGIVIEITFL